jgi:tRNA pseudouridine38-40 synthase
MRNVRALIAYDGSRFFGWQRQDGFDSVQQALEEALEALTGDSIVVHGAGRTDTGVHARGQVASFHVDTPLDDGKLARAINSHLPPGVAVLRVETCRADFHARFDACGKRYLYAVATTEFRPPYGQQFFHWTRDPLDLPAMRAAALQFGGEQDFSSLASAASPRSSNVRRLKPVRIVARRDRLAFLVEGDGFLYNMVRTIAGTLLDVGRGRLGPGDVAAILAAKDRTAAGPTAPANGLWMLRVFYDEPCFQGRSGGARGLAGAFDYGRIPFVR